MLSRRLRGERGQTSLFMALFISTMILLFAFTTNIGMLVHAKINLQNAADAAAYAGAAVQARQLTAVGYLNYEMRRALKEFLFYYTVRGQNAALPCYPMNSGGALNPFAGCPPVSGDARYNFQIFDRRETINETEGDFLPTVCVIFDKDNNYCQKKGVAGIPEFPSGGGWGVADPIVAAVRGATNQIIDKKLADCFSRTDINRQFLIAWLFNLYPIQDSLSMLRTGQDADDPFPFSNGLERIGILPRMAILRARIDNYEEVLNLNLEAEGSSLTITEDSINTFRGLVSENKKLDYFERPLQSFLSAKNNLVGLGDNGIFSNIELTELLPTSAGSVAVNPDLRNPPILARFNEIVGPVAVANSKFETMTGTSEDRGNCRQFRELRIIPRFPFGVTKDPNVITYYAVRLQARARLLFSPFGTDGTVSLSAYSAAKPFGSRVGKDIGLDQNHLMLAQGLLEKGDISTLGFPNPLVSADDTDSALGGFTRLSHLGYIRAAMAYTNRLDIGARLAGAYAPWEVGYYTVPANFDAPESIGLFEDNPVYQGKYFALSAPVVPVNQNGGSGGLEFLRSRVAGYLVGDITQRDTLERGPFAAFLAAVMSDDKWAALFGFMESQNQMRHHFIPDPLLNDEPELLSYVKGIGPRFTVAGMSQPQRRQLTSWNNQKTALDADLGIAANSELGLDIGRSGYSVRFVSFKTLQAGGRATNDPSQIGLQWSNPFNRFGAGDSAARIQDDLRKIKH
ncbi:MAG: pilus assembly protein TadG-related protein [Bacteriovoracia bacterium]